MKIVSFRSRHVDIAGHLYLPVRFDERNKYSAIVCVHPGSSVKEQTAGIYARKLAHQGHVALAYDASCQGDSTGEPRFAEEPATRVEDIRSAVDFLTTLRYVDEDSIGVLGICAGGGYAVNACMSERRIKAVGTVTVTNIGAGYRNSYSSKESLIETLEQIGRQRTREARGEPPRFVNWLPNSQEERERAGITGLDTTEAIDYYLTPRAQHENSTNLLLFRSVASVIAFDAFHLVEELLTQPLQIIIGNRVGKFGAFHFGHELFSRAKCKKDLFVIDGASHYDLYDRAPYVDSAVEKLTAFYGENLRPLPF